MIMVIFGQILNFAGKQRHYYYQKIQNAILTFHGKKRLKSNKCWTKIWQSCFAKDLRKNKASLPQTLGEVVLDDII